MTMTKSELIENIIKLTKVDPEKYFDYLNDKPDSYLKKLLKSITMLK
jgi:hypothetical protein